ncbi:hypothetical protein VCHA43P277_60257 [Vibrio chagasii]|nr:hypothetical protein VCHA34P126_10896 [Vibrio chagasii]CAH7167742.1 hypothetical protein VCHA41O247_10898 [Vibrio chagasii]CAH7337803.1 hypothetical protein VCHA43P277_60257 [Vibrio chagasii]CAH7481696.1 hypothetical protein VCHA50P420_70256 [Vibrio chagasii]
MCPAKKYSFFIKKIPKFSKNISSKLEFQGTRNFVPTLSTACSPRALTNSLRNLR